MASTTALQAEVSPILVQYGLTASVQWVFLPSWQGRAFGAFTSQAAKIFSPTGVEIASVGTIASVTDGDVKGIKISHNFGSTTTYPLGTDYWLQLTVTGTLCGTETLTQNVTEIHYFDVVTFPLDACISMQDVIGLYPSWEYNRRLNSEGEASMVIRSAHADLYYQLKANGYTPSTLVDRAIYRQALIHRAAMDGFDDGTPQWVGANRRYQSSWSLLLSSLRTMDQESPDSINGMIVSGILTRV